MWQRSVTDLFERRSKRVEKRYPREWQGGMDNVEAYLDALNEGHKPLQIIQRLGFVHNEKKDVYAVDQGKGKALSQIRLYLFPDLRTEILYLLTIGDKQSQPSDVKDSHDIVEQIIKQQLHKDSSHDNDKETDSKTTDSDGQVS